MLYIRRYNVYIGKNKDGKIDFIATKTNEKIYFQLAYLLADDKVINAQNSIDFIHFYSTSIKMYKINFHKTYLPNAKNAIKYKYGKRRG